MKGIYQILITERSGRARELVPVQFGVPFPRGLFFNHKELALITDNESVIPSVISPTTLWPDNSIRWCLVKTQITLGASQALQLKIARHPNKYDTTHCQSDLIEETDRAIRIRTQNCVFELDKTRFNILNKVTCLNNNIIDGGHCTLATEKYGKIAAEITGYRYHTDFSSDCPHSTDLAMEGQFLSDNGETVACFEARLTFFAKTDLLKCCFTIHNPRPAVHKSGLWDLGDPNSLVFSSLDLNLTLPGITQIDWKTGQNQPWKSYACQPFTIFQESSGGQNWNSPNHKDRNNEVPYTLNGFECRDQDSVLQTGQRASPSLQIQTQNGLVGVHIEKFWQNCPKSLGIDRNKLHIGLFPREFAGGFELQPGERKTHSFYLDFSKQADAIERIEEAVEITLNPAWIEQSKAFPYFSCDVSGDQIHRIIDEGVTGNNSFFAKREAIDEYGWRNFGDLYADHETDGYKGDDIFVSHYNNQYDPLYGFLRQFALTGNPKWMELADDLANHICDIDIYHTKSDKDEYNGGLFWHTDHYLNAETSTHRSFSKFHEHGAYIDHARGGGPGGQHCYTTGLLYHYLFTGNDASRNAVFQLTEWVTRVYEGSGTLLGILLAVKNRNRIDLKNITTGKYPFDRGTANYINALLDRYLLTHEQNTLHQVEHIIQNTIHPLDDIETRDLNNVEITWYYTVFLQSVCRYLQVKEELNSFDDSFYYARDALLHYADWMLKNEYPYLQKPEILEFPNHTWTAQDIRKINILLFAGYYSPGTSSAYSLKANELYTYILDNLPAEKTRTYTRILAILMQNHGAVTYFQNTGQAQRFGNIRQYRPLKKHGLFSAIRNVSATLLGNIRHFSLKKELSWLARRSDAIARLLGSMP